MKKLGICLILWLLTQGATLSALAACPDMPYDGYLVKMHTSGPMLFSDEMEYVVPGVYWLEDAAMAEDLVDLGVAEYAEPNYQVMLFDTQESESAQPWAYTAVQAASAAERGLSGEGVRIAIIDSGLDAENLNLENAVIVEGYDYITDSADMTDTIGHGTYVAQMIAGDGDDGMMRGIAPGVAIVPLRCFDNTGADVKQLLRAIEDAANPDKFDCDIINMSWGIAGSSEILEEALQNAYDAGVLLVAASGNVQAGAPQGTVMFPAVMDAVIGVGSVEEDMNISATSQQTSVVDLCAPGHGIAACSLQNKKTVVNGTSFAAPCVSAELALLLEAAPEMTPGFAAELLFDNAVDLGAEGRDDSYGYGFSDISALFVKSAWKVAPCGDDAVGFWLPDSQRRKAYAARYNEDGMMLALQIVELEPNQLWLCNDGLTAAGNGGMTIFVLTEDWLPHQKIFQVDGA